MSSSCQYPLGAASIGTRTVGTDKMARDISMWKRRSNEVRRGEVKKIEEEEEEEV